MVVEALGTILIRLKDYLKEIGVDAFVQLHS